MRTKSIIKSTALFLLYGAIGISSVSSAEENLTIEPNNRENDTNNLLLLDVINTFVKPVEEGFSTLIVNKKVREFENTVDLSDPLSAFISSMYMQADGMERTLFSEIFSDVFRSRIGNKKDSEVSEEKRNRILDRTICEVMVYNDSVAGVITDLKDEFLIGYVCFENGHWLNSGENIKKTIEDARKDVIRQKESRLKTLVRLDELKKVSTDTLSFINYLKENQKQPKEFILTALSDYPLVIYGETHFCKRSWNLICETILDPAFPEAAGTVFVEFPVCSQAAFDTFFAKETKDPTVILDILGEQHYWGWDDRGFYEFCLDLWDVNAKLPPDKKIKVIATDLGLPWLSIKTNEDYKKYPRYFMQDRENSMAKVIEEYMLSENDGRSHLFIVGSNHALKNGNDPHETKAAALLSNKLSKEKIFSINTHSPIIGNYEGVFGKVRNGLFDYVFESLGNVPVAFSLKNSLFGNEPFDADEQWRVWHSTGTYADNYDGYLFLGPLEGEEYYILYELFTDEYFEEIKRRAVILNAKSVWGFPIEELTREKIRDKRKAHGESKRWIFE